MKECRTMTSSLLVVVVQCLLLIALAPLVKGLPMQFAADMDPQKFAEIIRFSKSAEIRNYMNANKDPCKNFYDFACGNYYRINSPTLSQLQSNTFLTLSSAMNRKFANVLQNEDATYTAIDKKVKSFYESCLKLEHTSQKMYEAKLKELIREFGQMPAVEGAKWREDDFDWLQTVAEISHKYDIRIIVGPFVQVDLVNNTENRVYVALQDKPLESASVYTDAVHRAIRNGRRSVMAKRLRGFLGLDKKLAKRIAKEIFEFEANLFAGYDDSYDVDGDEGEEEEEEEGMEENVTAEEEEEEEQGFESFEKYLGTIEDLHRKCTNYSSQLDIKRLLNITMGLESSDKVYDVLEDDLENLAITIERTPKRIVANYIYYYLLENFILVIPHDKNELDKKCVAKTREHFSPVLDKMIYRKYTTNKTEEDVRYMWQTIKSAFHNVLESDKLTWMGADTRRYALEKLDAMRMEINSHARSNFNEEFAELLINNHDYVENMKSIFKDKAIKTRRKLKEPPMSYVDSQSLSFTPVYLPAENLIKVPVAILQPYYLWSDLYPNALKFSTLGFLIAHELIHGFDEDGRTYGKTGNQHDWWDKGSNEYFTKQTKCFNTQYRNYTYDGHHLPEFSTQSENIADNSGIRLAYGAYLQWYEDALRTYQNLDLESMPRLNYNSKELFFISYGQLWCSATHPLLRSVMASTDDHAPGRFRVIGPLSNLPEFSQLFKCPVGSTMNPAKRCIIY